VQITPNAKHTEVIGLFDDAIKLRLQAQPIEGRANEALVKFLASALGVPKRAVTLISGQTSRRKLIEVQPCILTPEQAAQLLGL
jgi:hypothetical protein